MKILFICKKRNDSYGNSIGLVNSAKFVINAIRKMGVQAELAIADDANSIDKLVTDYNPEMVVIEALWVVPEKFSELLAIPRHAAREWVVRVHSKTPFLSQEGMAFDWIKRYVDEGPPNLIVAPNSNSLTDDLTLGLGLDKIRHLPNIYDPHGDNIGILERIEAWIYDGMKDTIDIGCFGAIRPLKNTVAQAVSAMMFAKRLQRKLRFHVNGDRVESRGDEIVRNLRAVFEGGPYELVEHPWMQHKDFIKLVRTMDLGMQVSMSESFNIVAADFAYNNVPIVVSHDVEWANIAFKADMNSSLDMSKKLMTAWNMRRTGIAYVNKLALERYNKDALETWRQFLDQADKN
jgi:hypothetical protein